MELKEIEVSQFAILNHWLYEYLVFYAGILIKEISPTGSERMLRKLERFGVYVSKDLNWPYHINYMVNKANRVLGSIKHTLSY
jgi:hypothetical protein